MLQFWSSLCPTSCAYRSIYFLVIDPSYTTVICCYCLLQQGTIGAFIVSVCLCVSAISTARVQCDCYNGLLGVHNSCFLASQFAVLQDKVLFSSYSNVHSPSRFPRLFRLLYEETMAVTYVHVALLQHLAQCTVYMLYELGYKSFLTVHSYYADQTTTNMRCWLTDTVNIEKISVNVYVRI